MMHTKCRNSVYFCNGSVQRPIVPDDKVPWSIVFEDYAPILLNSKKFLSNKEERPPYADPDVSYKEEYATLQFNCVDENQIDRRSHLGHYELHKYQNEPFDALPVPLNPIGRTGIRGRGALGKWGPNHAADPIITRWKRDSTNNNSIIFDDKSKKRIVQFVAILRSDRKEWAIPGGMVDCGEEVSETLKREFAEEALNSMEASDEEKRIISQKVNEAFKNPTEVYRGYVDDPRNTDNAWMETVAMNFHDSIGDGLGQFPLSAGDDAISVKWTDVSDANALYANHKQFIGSVARMLDAHW